jgi:hypothetical protein
MVFSPSATMISLRTFARFSRSSGRFYQPFEGNATMSA